VPVDHTVHFLTDIRDTAPPEAFAVLARSVQARGLPRRWRALFSRVPALE
jgi:hypothetical protein